MAAFAWCSGSPSAAPSNAGLTGVLGHRLFELRNKPRFMWLVRVTTNEVLRRRLTLRSNVKRSGRSQFRWTPGKPSSTG